jgi:hypothetical protein
MINQNFNHLKGCLKSIEKRLYIPGDGKTRRNYYHCI